MSSCYYIATTPEGRRAAAREEVARSGLSAAAAAEIGLDGIYMPPQFFFLSPSFRVIFTRTRAHP